MGRLTAVVHLSLDGVLQAPGRPDEDGRHDFRHGGWATPYGDHVLAEAMGSRMAAGMAGGALLLGRRTYEDFAAVWPQQSDPVAGVLNAMTKYVVSQTLSEPLPWQNSVLRAGDAPALVTELKRDRDLTVLGSGELLRSLLPHRLVDEYLLTVHPLVLGAGRRLFDGDGHLLRLDLVDSITTSTGVLVTTYRPSPP
jgi:dihydrofolate reductase